MSPARPRAICSSLDALLTAGTLGSLSDGELLDHFRRDAGSSGQEAFRMLVERHGAMVLRVCRGLLKDPHEAEDAFQATFLVLVRRAASIRRRETIGSWLYGVASRVARRARIRSDRRRKREVSVEVDPPSRPESVVEPSAEDRALHDEIRHLPESLRAPLILCCLEGYSYDLAARQLGLRESTLRGRLHRARKRLESRLRHRGLPTTALARTVSPASWPAAGVPPSLIESTARFAVRWSSLSGLLVGADGVPGSIAILARGVIHAMHFQTLKMVGLATIFTLGAVGTLVVAQPQTGAKPAGPTPGTSTPTGKGAAPAPQPSEKAPSPVDLEEKTRQILRKLDEKIALDIPADPSLDQLLKAIKKATTDANFTGIPIHVDPIGLQEAGVSMSLHVSVPQGGRLSFVLHESLRLPHLSYLVKDGFLMISSRAEIADQRLDELNLKIDRLLKAMDRLEHPNGDRRPSAR